ncbi:hypothetical protein D9Q98_007164 [Chlorella vulgaris]|uniref:PPPDE domain-containing protein n=1 Tax=Chlorella vulgaris TaxID=3077 RepID=A0A9D4TJS3_CHLVU|nr:hypothetical protein D9Q98_007164 [Chlorella vulgaris]
MATTLSPGSLKRQQRGASSDALLQSEGAQPAAKRQEAGPVAEDHCAFILPLRRGESQPAYFARLTSRLHRRSPFSQAHAFDREGLYIYKRPVQSAAGDKAALLASGGSVFHHVVVYVKKGDELTALEFSPSNNMDITDDMTATAAPSPVVLRPAPAPEPQHLPMLHIGVPVHALEDEAVQRALRFAESTDYHALQNNCIAFSDFAVRVLTGGVVRNAPIIFDAVVGQVPPVESPLLGLLALMMQLSWHDVCDGSRLTRAFLQQHPEGLPPPPPGAQAVLLLEQEEDDAVEEAAASKVALSACGTTESPGRLPAGLLPGAALQSMLQGMLPPGTLEGLAAQQALGPMPAHLITPVAMPVARPAGSSSSSEDTVGAAQLGAISGDPSLTASLSSGGDGCTDSATVASKPPLGVRGMALPPRKAGKARSAAV